jgi:hypothetical protein
VLLARELLRDPHFPLRAAHELGVEVKWPLTSTSRAQSGKGLSPSTIAMGLKPIAMVEGEYTQSITSNI